jgi:hypothetical protein
LRHGSDCGVIPPDPEATVERGFYAGTWQALAAAIPTATWIVIAVAATIAVFVLFHINTPDQRRL